MTARDRIRLGIMVWAYAMGRQVGLSAIEAHDDAVAACDFVEWMMPEPLPPMALGRAVVAEYLR
jgi:hypothetical protein